MNIDDSEVAIGSKLFQQGNFRSFSALTTSIVGLFVLLVGFLLWSQPPTVGMVVAPILTVLIGLSIRDSSAVAVVTLLNYPYALGAYIAARNGITFFPRPPLSSYEYVAHEQTLVLFVSFGATLFLGVARMFQKAAATGWHEFRHAASVSVGLVQKRFWLVSSIALIVGAHDALFLMSNLGSILSSGRHTFREEFWVGNGPFGMVLALVVGLALVILALGNRRLRARSLLALAVFWLPSIVAGSRNYFSVLMLGALFVAFCAVRSGRNRILLGLVACAGIAAFAWLPTLWSANELVGFNEWILPTSSYLPLALGMFTVEGLGATPLAQQWALLLPGSFRPFPVHLYAEVFAEQKFTNVGVAGNPWSDAYDSDLVLRVLVFMLTFVGVFTLASLLRKLHPIIPFLAFGLTAFWGRSVFWNVAVILIYSTVLLRIFVPVRNDRGGP